VEGAVIALPPFPPPTSWFRSADWFLRSEASASPADAGTFSFGLSGRIRGVGDWDRSGTTTIGVVNPATAIWFLRNEDSSDPADGAFVRMPPST
jgi:hypothetical protein